MMQAIDQSNSCILGVAKEGKILTHNHNPCPRTYKDSRYKFIHIFWFLKRRGEVLSVILHAHVRANVEVRVHTSDKAINSFLVHGMLITSSFL